MAKIVITIRTDNSAFDADPGAEMHRILSELAERYESEGLGVDNHPISDINGNKVGNVTTYVNA